MGNKNEWILPRDIYVEYFLLIFCSENIFPPEEKEIFAID